jgi:hypothetical protein
VNQIRQFLPAVLLSALLVFTGCRPKSVPAASISDGTIVLLKSGITNAAFVVTRQSGSPEVVDYTWISRCDGKTTFDPKDTACQTGAVSSAKSIVFGSFDIQWSSAGSSGGYVYYPSRYRLFKMPWGEYRGYKILGGPEMAVTTEPDLAKINANDPRWKFQR